MCGIAGFVNFPHHRHLAEQANIIQKHRGPDHQGIWSNDHLSLAQQRLSIIDLSEAANQPFVKHELVIVFNGEIYNYQQLRSDMEKTRHIRFISQSDTEVVLEAYRIYGQSCLSLFRGMFAFAIYHTQSGHLFLARDHFGIKPLFYTNSSQSFAFASELKTLVKLTDIRQQLNYQSLISSINYQWVSGNETMFQNCHKLPPAHCLSLKNNLELSIQSYWTIADAVNTDFSFAEWQSQLSDCLQDSIAQHLVADVEVSSFLSGGLDSSLIAVLADRDRQKLSTYTIKTSAADKRIEKMPADEIFAGKIAAKYHFRHHEIEADPVMMEMLPKMVYHLDEPIGDPAAINTFLICQRARQNGIKVLLSGMGADELFFGYRRQHATLMAQTYQRLPAIFRRAAEALSNLLPVRLGGVGLKPIRWAKRFFAFAGLPLDQAYMRSYSYYDKSELQQLFNWQFNHEIESIYQEHQSIFYDKFKGDAVNQMCYTDILLFMNGLNLTYSDRASMAASVEIRVPFIDKKVVELAMQIPGIYKYRQHQGKYILKKAAEPFLPKEIVYRPKASFGAPIRSWIFGDLKEMVNDLLGSRQCRQRGIFNTQAIDRLIEKDRQGVADNAYQIYQLLTMELWFRTFID